MTVEIQKLEEPSTTYWITRDATNGVLEDHVDIWDERPQLQVNGDTSFWLDRNFGIGARWGRFPISAIAHWHRTLPDTPRECIHVG